MNFILNFQSEVFHILNPIKFYWEKYLFFLNSNINKNQHYKKLQNIENENR